MPYLKHLAFFYVDFKFMDIPKLDNALKKFKSCAQKLKLCVFRFSHKQDCNQFEFYESSIESIYSDLHPILEQLNSVVRTVIENDLFFYCFECQLSLQIRYKKVEIVSKF